jgi:splicing factor 3A subunit 3
VAEKLKHEGRQELAAQQKAVEMEDDDGNVYSADVYQQLKKQGVI